MVTDSIHLSTPFTLKRQLTVKSSLDSFSSSPTTAVVDSNTQESPPWVNTLLTIQPHTRNLHQNTKDPTKPQGKKVQTCRGLCQDVDIGFSHDCGLLTQILKCAHSDHEVSSPLENWTWKNQNKDKLFTWLCYYSLPSSIQRVMLPEESRKNFKLNFFSHFFFLCKALLIKSSPV